MEKTKQEEVLDSYWAAAITAAQSGAKAGIIEGTRAEELLRDDVDIKSLAKQVEADLQKMIPYGKYFSFSSNDIYVFISHVVPTVTSESPAFRVKKLVRSGKIDTDMIKAMCDDFWESNHLSRLWERVVLSALLYPFGCVKTVITDVRKRKVEIRYVPPDQIFIDPEAETLDERDINWIAHKRSISIGQCKAEKWEHVDELCTANEIDEANIPQEYLDFETVDVYEIWDKRTEEVLYFSSDTSRVHKRQGKKYFRKLQDKNLDKQFPFTFLSFHEDAHCKPFSPTKAFRKRVVTKRAVMSKFLDLVISASNAKVIYDSGSGLTDGMIDRLLRSDDILAVGIDISTAKPPTVIQQQVSARGLEIMHSIQQAELNEETGITRIERGNEPASRETATFTSSVVSAMRSRFSIFVKKIEQHIGSTFGKLTALWFVCGYERKYLDNADIDVDKSKMFPAEVVVARDSLMRSNDVIEMQSVLTATQAIANVAQLKQADPEFDVKPIMSWILKVARTNAPVIPTEKEEEKKVEVLSGVSAEDAARKAVEDVGEDKLRVAMEGGEQAVLDAITSGAGSPNAGGPPAEGAPAGAEG